MNSVRSSNLSLKYQRFTTSRFKDIVVLIFDFFPKDSIPLPFFILEELQGHWARWTAFPVKGAKPRFKSLCRGYLEAKRYPNQKFCPYFSENIFG